MLATWLQWTMAVVIVALPVLLLLAFNGTNVADSRGRRLSRRWRGEALQASRNGHEPRVPGAHPHP